MKIRIETLVRSDIAQVWSAWTTPADINQWNAASDDWHNPASRNDLRVGGTFCYRMESKDGRMGFDFEGTYTRVVPGQAMEMQRQGWQSILDRFAAYVEAKR